MISIDALNKAIKVNGKAKKSKKANTAASIKSLKKLRKKIGVKIAEKKRIESKINEKSATASLGKFGKAGEKGRAKVEAQRRTKARAKGIKFIRRNGRIIPVRTKGK